MTSGNIVCKTVYIFWGYASWLFVQKHGCHTNLHTRDPRVWTVRKAGSQSCSSKYLVTVHDMFECMKIHYKDVIMGSIASQITSLTLVYSAVYSDADQRKHQSSASLAFVRGIHRGPVHSLHKWPITRKMFPFDGVIMKTAYVNAADFSPSYNWMYS